MGVILIRCITLSLLICSYLPLWSPRGTDQFHLPQIGDQYHYKTIQNPDLGSSPDESFDPLTHFHIDRFDQEEVLKLRSPIYGEAYPLISRSDFMIGAQDFQKYYQIRDDKIYLTGIQSTAFGLSDDLTFRFSDHLVFDPQMFLETIQTESQAISELYEQNLSRLTDDYDLRRYRYVIHQDIHTSYRPLGRTSIILQNESIDLIVIEIIQKTSNKLIRIPYNSEEELHEISGQLPKVQKHISYAYYTTDQFFPVLNLEMDLEDSRIKTATTYRRIASNAQRLAGRSITDFIIEPNPSFGETQLILHVKNSGNYTIEIKNILGQLLQSRSVRIDGDLRLPVDFSSLPKGSYFCNLTDDSGRVLVSKKLVILKP